MFGVKNYSSINRNKETFGCLNIQTKNKYRGSHEEKEMLSGKRQMPMCRK